MKVSFITTVFNEERDIKKLLESLAAQTKLPDEIVVVDGGSTDSTMSILSSYTFPSHTSNNKKIVFKIILKKGNRSVGRNEAIRQSTGDVIAVTDSGCMLDEHWLEKITQPFENHDIDVVSGFYKPVCDSIFEKSLAAYTCVMPDHVVPEDFLPSSRSVAFRRSVWKKAGGYPEYLDTCEDLAFDRELKRVEASFVFVKDAIVYWPQRVSFEAAFRQFYTYAVGDGMAHYFRPQLPLLFLRYIIGVVLLLIYLLVRTPLAADGLIISVCGYILWSIRKNYRYVEDPQAYFYLPALQFVADIAVMGGTIVGAVKRIWVTPEKR